MNQDDLKAMAGRHAAAHIDPFLTPGAIIGVGTGSTTNHFIDALAESKHRFEGCVASSQATAERLARHGLAIHDLNTLDEMHIYVDGADECNPNLELIKGGGGALTREKILASVARKFVCILDASKLVDVLGAFPLPVEVIPMARSAVARRLVALGGEPVYREGFVTDNGNVILDIHGMRIQDPSTLENELNAITGLVTAGLFAKRRADLLLVATEDGVREVRAGEVSVRLPRA